MFEGKSSYIVVKVENAGRLDHVFVMSNGGSVLAGYRPCQVSSGVYVVLMTRTPDKCFYLMVNNSPCSHWLIIYGPGQSDCVHHYFAVKCNIFRYFEILK